MFEYNIFEKGFYEEWWGLKHNKNMGKLHSRYLFLSQFIKRENIKEVRGKPKVTSPISVKDRL
ncbi:hypothetical protein CQA53_06065 [Helicobacter didelphidarum]|uniref:Uncharacterized protein n=1 Tax=Helicobacter didelphidarum TaxID=2040648 RepID=A0A3D8IKS9_9HELI|nr:hypothetical protein CQA53_06065 [Helicobacter didelphidarum]